MATGENALIGYNGFVGSVLRRQAEFAGLFNSRNSESLAATTWDTVVCAGAPAAKWIANGDPDADRENIQRLMRNLADVKCRRFVLISTIDVFAVPVGVDETTAVEDEGLHPYGLHRRQLEKFVEERFENRLVLRLPGLVGPGLRKNVIYDFLNDNNVEQVDSRGRFQFYPMVNLWFDIVEAMGRGITLLHLSVEPLEVAEVAREGFNRVFENTLEAAPAVYDFRSIHADDLKGGNGYCYTRRESLQAIRAYAQSEPKRAKN